MRSEQDNMVSRSYPRALTIRYLLLCVLAIFPVAGLAQSETQSVMRMVCYDSAESTNGERTGGWTVIITQMTNEQHPAETFIPDENGNFAEKFPMFEDTFFFVSVFEETAGISTAEDLSDFADALLVSEAAPPWILAEGNRVGTLLDMSWGESSTFEYDSADQSRNLYRNTSTQDDRVPVCQRPFAYEIPFSG